MNFTSPGWLWALALVPLVLGMYLVSRARRRRYAVRFTALPSLRAAAVPEPTWWRHLPAALLLLAIGALALALARPKVTVRLPVRQASVVLVTDHSGSMQADDVQPTRLAAAERAANTFIDQLPGGVRVGAVTFSSSPDAVQAPSTGHDAARRVIDSQVAEGATDTGDALALALQMLHQSGKGKPAAAIVLLSDGSANAGEDPLAVARQARSARVPIYTVALGNSDATVPNPDPFGPPLSAAPDPQLMQQIASASAGRSFGAQDAGQLSAIYRTLGTQLGTVTRRREVTWEFALAGLAALLAAGGLSLRSSGRLP